METPTVLSAPEGVPDRVLRRLALTRAVLRRLIDTMPFAAGSYRAPTPELGDRP